MQRLWEQQTYRLRIMYDDKGIRDVNGVYEVYEKNEIYHNGANGMTYTR